MHKVWVGTYGSGQVVRYRYALGIRYWQVSLGGKNILGTGRYLGRVPTVFIMINMIRYRYLCIRYRQGTERYRYALGTYLLVHRYRLQYLGFLLFLNPFSNRAVLEVPYALGTGTFIRIIYGSFFFITIFKIELFPPKYKNFSYFLSILANEVPIVKSVRNCRYLFCLYSTILYVSILHIFSKRYRTYYFPRPTNGPYTQTFCSG